MKHTKGPWKMREHILDYRELHIIESGNDEVCEIPKLTLNHRGNADLIVAAPELLDAAEYAIKELGQIIGLVPLIAAVYKAKGA